MQPQQQLQEEDSLKAFVVVEGEEGKSGCSLFGTTTVLPLKTEQVVVAPASQVKQVHSGLSGEREREKRVVEDVLLFPPTATQ